MDSGTAITGAIIVAVCILPFIFLGRGGKKRKKELFQALSSLAATYKAKITQHEIWGHSAIGLDEDANILFFIRRANGQETSRQVNLAAIEKCTPIQTGSTLSNNQKVIEKLELCLSPVAKNEPDILLEFFNEASDNQLVRELLLTEKWARALNSRLRHSPR